jgi:hypothetical protein
MNDLQENPTSLQCVPNSGAAMPCLPALQLTTYCGAQEITGDALSEGFAHPPHLTSFPLRIILVNIVKSQRPKRPYDSQIGDLVSCNDKLQVLVLGLIGSKSNFFRLVVIWAASGRCPPAFQRISFTPRSA